MMMTICAIQVDGVSLEGFSNEQAVDVLRCTGQVTRLKLARHCYGSKYEQLLHAAAVGQSFQLTSTVKVKVNVKVSVEDSTKNGA